MRYPYDGIEKISHLVLRKPRSGCLEGRTAVIQPILGGDNRSGVFQVVEYDLAETERQVSYIVGA